MALGKHNVRVQRARREDRARARQRAGRAGRSPTCRKAASTRRPAHMRFPGTITVPDDAFEKVLESAARSFRLHGFRDIVFLGDHGGYQKDLTGGRRPARTASGRRRRVRVHAIVEYYRVDRDRVRRRRCKSRGYRDDEIGTHAGLADTSLALAVDPRLVRSDRLRRRAARAPPTASTAIRAARAPSSGKLGVDAIVAQTVAAIRKATAPPLTRAARSTRTHPFVRNSVNPHCRIALLALAARPRLRRCLRAVAALARPRRRLAAVATVPGMPPVPDPPTSTARPTAGKLSAGGRRRPAARLRAAPPVERRLRDRSGDAQGRRQVQGRPQSAARRAVVGPAHAVGRQQRREHAPTAA